MEAERIEHLTFVASADVAYSVALEHHATRTLRVTHGYRREEGAWKLAHRHADPLVGRQG